MYSSDELFMHWLDRHSGTYIIFFAYTTRISGATKLYNINNVLRQELHKSVHYSWLLRR